MSYFLAPALKRPKQAASFIISESEIINACALIHGVTPKQILGQRRLKEIVEARFLAMYIFRNMRDRYTFKKIADVFGKKDHTSVMHAVAEFASRYETDLITRKKTTALLRSYYVALPDVKTVRILTN